MNLFPRCRQDEVYVTSEGSSDGRAADRRAARTFGSDRVFSLPQGRQRLRVEHTLSTGEAFHKSYPFACFFSLLRSVKLQSRFYMSKHSNREVNGVRPPEAAAS